MLRIIIVETLQGYPPRTPHCGRNNSLQNCEVANQGRIPRTHLIDKRHWQPLLSNLVSGPELGPIRSAGIPRIRTNLQGVDPSIVFSHRAEDEEAVADLRGYNFELGELVTGQPEVNSKLIGP